MNKKTKLILWHGLVAVTAYLLWLDIARWFEAIRLEGDFASYAVVTFAFLVVLVALGFLLFKERWLVLSFGGLTWLAFILNFGLSGLNITGLVILILTGLGSRSDVVSELSERVKVNSKVILRRGVVWFVLGLFVLVSFAAFQSPVFEKLGEMNTLPSESRTYIKTVVENTIGQRIETGSEAERQQIINQVSEETFREINTFLEPYFQYAPPVLAFALFLILWGLSWIFIWISVGVGMLVFWTLKKTGFVKIEEVEMKAEILIV